MHFKFTGHWISSWEFFSRISFPWAPEYPSRAILKSWRYPQLCVDSSYVYKQIACEKDTDEKFIAGVFFADDKFIVDTCNYTLSRIFINSMTPEINLSPVR